ncbi:MAG: PSD1 domain-containing protein [Planctomycetales bacterium]|nr:PSD1 domain-containing protein [Planctomycetales bacterium]
MPKIVQIPKGHHQRSTWPFPRYLILPVAWSLVAFFAAPLCHAVQEASAATAQELEFFERNVRPLLVEHCYQCHSQSADKVQGGLLLDSQQALFRGGESGQAVVPGDVEASLIIQAVRYESYEMPPKGKLTSQEIATLERWVAMGAPWPDELPPESKTTSTDFDIALRRDQHWVWQPICAPAVPDVMRQSWPHNDIDRFILAELEKADLVPSADASKLALVRRLYFDLIGLPPTPEQMDAFVNDNSPQAIERLVDGLLDSPHFGERWGRHWLDLVRYAESRGHEFDNDAPNAFQYRDYVIRAFNADVPYDQFVAEHIAGDLLTQPRLNPQLGFNESILGTGFWFLGEWVHSPVDVRKDESDRFDNMLDVMSKTFLGVTLACARCHDHKFDAISTADYYSLSGFLQSSDYRQVRFQSLEHNREVASQLAKLDHEYQSRIASLLESSGLSRPTMVSTDDSDRAFVAVDYGQVSETEFLQDGFIFGAGPRDALAATLEPQEDKSLVHFPAMPAAASDAFWDGLESISDRGAGNKSKLASLPRSGRTLRTPSFALTSGDVSCLVKGSGHVFACVASHRLVAGPLHGETIQEIKPEKEWVELNLDRYVGQRVHLEFTPDEGSQLTVYLVTQGANSEVCQRISQRAAENARRATEYELSARAILSREAPTLLDQWTHDRGQLQRKVMKRSELAMAMMDGVGEDDHILIRGNSSMPGAMEPRHFLEAISGNQPMPINNGSGRLELAQHINDVANPLTSRVIVNRVWHYLLGRGIVPTTDDFGVLGQRPTHPELLDYLAVLFAEQGHSIKEMIRSIVLSRTYQMSSHASANALAADPENLLWHYRPPKRLEGEVIRDSLLALAGHLDTTFYGPSIPIHLTSFMEGRGRPSESGPSDGARRRSIYVAVRRNFLSPFMLTFDSPAPFSTMGRRNVSNVPAQALILMNDPFVIAQAAAWGKRARLFDPDPRQSVDWMYRMAFARSATSAEIDAAVHFLAAEGAANDEAWTDLAHALINAKEFIFLR